MLDSVICLDKQKVNVVVEPLLQLEIPSLAVHLMVKFGVGFSKFDDSVLRVLNAGKKGANVLTLHVCLLGLVVDKSAVRVGVIYWLLNLSLNVKDARSFAVYLEGRLAGGPRWDLTF